MLYSTGKVLPSLLRNRACSPERMRASARVLRTSAPSNGRGLSPLRVSSRIRPTSLSKPCFPVWKPPAAKKWKFPVSPPAWTTGFHPVSDSPPFVLARTAITITASMNLSNWFPLLRQPRRLPFLPWNGVREKKSNIRRELLISIAFR